MSESLSSNSPKFPLAILLIGLSTPGVLALLGYYLIDHHGDGPLRRSVKAFVDHNFLLWAAVVVPSILVFGLCVIFKVMEWANLSRWEPLAKGVVFWSAVTWVGAVLWNVLSLALFRSSEGHGPDMVGQEVSRFLLPLAIATLLSLGFAAAQNPQSSFPRFGLLAMTAAITFIEILVYLGAIMR